MLPPCRAGNTSLLARKGQLLLIKHPYGADRLPCRQHKQNLGSGLKTLAETLQHSDDEWVRIMAAAAGQYSGPLTLAAVEKLSVPVSYDPLLLYKAACLPRAQLQSQYSGPLTWQLLRSSACRQAP